MPTVLGSDGSGSGLDADKLDNLDSSAFAPSTHAHDHGSLTGLGDDDHSQYFNLSQNEKVTGRPAFNGGTVSLPPFSVNSTTLVKNLNADKLDGKDASAFGDITGVTAGTGLSGGGTTGNVTVNVKVPLSLSGSSNDAIIKGSNSYPSGRAVVGYATARAGYTSGVYGQSASDSGKGVYGYATATSGTTFGVRGDTVSTSGLGVYGLAAATSGEAYGVYGRTKSDSGRGVYGYASASSGTSYGVYGESASENGHGVYGTNLSSGNYGYLGSENNGVYGYSTMGNGVYGVSNTGYGVYGYSGGLAGYFVGNVYVDGFLSKAGGSFQIDHPLDPENKYLNHSFVESPDMMNIYNGNVVLDATGQAWVELPEWFEALNKDFRYQLTPIGAPGPNLYIASKIEDNRFKIAGGTAGMEVSWQVTGIRQDLWAEANRIPVEEDKPEEELGYYLHPELYGQAEEKSIEWARRPEMMQRMKEMKEVEGVSETDRLLEVES
jgi:hypothetical protein